MKKNRSQLLKATLFLLAGLTPACGLMLDVVPDLTVDGERVHLSDLVRNPGSLPDEWGRRVVVDAPVAGDQRSVRLSDIALSLNRFEDMQDVVLRGPVEIQVRSRAQAIEFEKLDQALDTYLGERTENDFPRYRVNRRDAVIRGLPFGTFDISVEGLVAGASDGGMIAHMRITPHEGKGEESSRLVAVQLVELHPFWAVARPVLRGSVLAPDDLKVEWVETGSTTRYYPASEPVAGMEARRNFQTGQMLSVGSLAEPLYAKRGEMVRVVSNQGGLTVTLRARALVDGRRSERIACMNEQSGRRMHVRLIDIREAVLDEMEDSRS